MDDYHVLAQIGEGSFGRVFKARRKKTGILVAIKTINKHGLNVEDLASFRSEIEILRAIDHPNVMKFIDVVETGDEFCLVSELADGDLYQVIEDEQTLTESEIKPIFAQLISVLDYLHSQRIIHRDIKPQNILVSSNNVIKLCDFGFARALSANSLKLDSIKGTPLYMAPELIQECPYDSKVDVWSLGVILYHLYYGKPPFYSDSIFKLIELISNSPILWHGDISQEFRSLLSSMLCKDATQRPSSHDLVNHPFVKDVDLSLYVDVSYERRRTQYKEALLRCSEQKSAPSFNLDEIFSSPSSFSPDELDVAVEHVLKEGSESRYAESFCSSVNDFISSCVVSAKAFRACIRLLCDDYERFMPLLASVNYTSIQTMPDEVVDFLFELYLKGSVVNICKEAPLVVSFKPLEELPSGALRDRLFHAIASEEEPVAIKAMGLIAFFVRYLSTFLASLVGDSASKMAPILSVTFVEKTNVTLRVSCLHTLSRMILKDPTVFSQIQPLERFMKELSTFIKTSTELYSLSSSLTFIDINLSSLRTSPLIAAMFDVPSVPSASSLIKHTDDVFCQLITQAGTPPFDDHTCIGLTTLIKSVFELIHPSHKCVCQFLDVVENALPVHRMAVAVGCMHCLNLLFMHKLTAESAAEALLQLKPEEFPLIDIEDIIDSVKDRLEEGASPAVAMAFSEITSVSSILPNRLFEVVTVMFSNTKYLDASLAICTFLIKGGSDLNHKLIKCGIEKPIIESLRSKSVSLRRRGCSLVGSVCKTSLLPSESVIPVTSSLLDLISDDTNKDCQRIATYGLGNLLYRHPDAAMMIIKEHALLIKLLRDADTKIVENTAGIIGNLTRCEDSVIDDAISTKLLYELVEVLQRHADISTKIILSLSPFCKRENAMEYLKSIDIAQKIAPFSSSADPRVKKVIHFIIKSSK